MSCLYILEINPLSVALFANIFSHSEGCLFTLFMVSFSGMYLFELEFSSFLDIYPGVGLVDHMVVLFLFF